MSAAPPANGPPCAPPGTPDNGYLLPVYGPQDRLVAVRYKCYPPFTLIGSHQRVCQRDASWSGEVPTCLKGDFGFSSRPLFARLFTQDAFARVFSSSDKYTPAGQTSGSRCSPPPTLQNGYHKPAPATAGGAEAIEYFCNKPYILSGSRRIACSSHGSWSSRQPKCVRGSPCVGLEEIGRAHV